MGTKIGQKMPKRAKIWFSEAPCSGAQQSWEERSPLVYFIDILVKIWAGYICNECIILSRNVEVLSGCLLCE